ncbi:MULTISPECIES: hypothetical protein [Corynebacterium]|uniref:Uncharacterized protein n=1 Tax=Corynebacterium provencense TaxID=1737425 RepID=A0A2Z3YR88_9CORY|nr:MULTISPECIES: hypothetical protein [Corynebacterium]AWT25570.1 hypothetical protein Csp1_07610 [Corynebacterium provencense]MCI1256400.1 hypothetical protein [Corynebacterium provencense]
MSGNRAGDGGSADPGPRHLPASEYRRRRTVWESVLGFLAVFDVLALIQAVWNLTGDAAVWPSLVLLVFLLLTWGAWRQWNRYRD